MNDLRERGGSDQMQISVRVRAAGLLSLLKSRLWPSNEAPHARMDDEARSATLAMGFWEDRKAEERKGKPKQGVLAGIPLALPGLTRALKLQAKAAKVGFDWPSVENV